MILGWFKSNCRAVPSESFGHGTQPTQRVPLCDGEGQQKATAGSWDKNCLSPGHFGGDEADPQVHI